MLWRQEAPQECYVFMRVPAREQRYAHYVAARWRVAMLRER